MKNKKIIAIIVAIVLVVSIFAIGTMANTKNTSISISIDKTELSAGQSATVTVKASADYPVATASIPVFYDKTMVTVSNATATLTDFDGRKASFEVVAYDNAGVIGKGTHERFTIKVDSFLKKTQERKAVVTE